MDALMLGVSGLRGTVGGTLTPPVVSQLAAAVAALTASGIEVIDLDIVTTPGVAMMVKHLNADAALIATASHNPIQWNGLKYLNADGIALPAAEAGRLGLLF